MSGATRRASRAARDILIFGLTLAACSVGLMVGMLAINLTGANDEPRPAARITPAEVRHLADALEEIRPGDLPPEQRESVDEARDLLESIEEGDTVVVTPSDPPPSTTVPAPSTAPPATVAPEREVHQDHRTGPTVTLYPPPTTEAP